MANNKPIVGPKEGPNGEDAVQLIWEGDHTRCGRFFIVKNMVPKQTYPFELFGRPGFGRPATGLESEYPGGGWPNREEARAWAGAVAYQLEKGSQDEA